MTPLAPAVADALARSGTIEITTTGRKTGSPRRIEIMIHSLDGRLVITGHPGFPRGWLANVAADPRLILHLRGPRVDVPARARVVTDPAERELLLAPVSRLWRIPLPVMVESAPLIEVTPD